MSTEYGKCTCRRYNAGLCCSQKVCIIHNNPSTSNILCLRELVNLWFPVREYLRTKKELIREHVLKHVTSKRRSAYFGSPTCD